METSPLETSTEGPECHLTTTLASEVDRSSGLASSTRLLMVLWAVKTYWPRGRRQLPPKVEGKASEALPQRRRSIVICPASSDAVRVGEPQSWRVSRTPSPGRWDSSLLRSRYPMAQSAELGWTPRPQRAAAAPAAAVCRDGLLQWSFSRSVFDPSGPHCQRVPARSLPSSVSRFGCWGSGSLEYKRHFHHATGPAVAAASCGSEVRCCWMRLLWRRCWNSRHSCTPQWQRPVG